MKVEVGRKTKMKVGRGGERRTTRARESRVGRTSLRWQSETRNGTRGHIGKQALSSHPGILL